MNQKRDQIEDFDRVLLIDFEFNQPDGSRPHPRCVVVREWSSGHTIRQWLLGAEDPPNFKFGSNDLVVAYYASAEVGAMLELAGNFH